MPKISSFRLAVAMGPPRAEGIRGGLFFRGKYFEIEPWSKRGKEIFK